MESFFQQVINGVSLGSIYALVALGYTMVYGVLRLINFAHGDIYMLGAFIGYYVSKLVKGTMHGWFLETMVVLLASMAACALIGVLMERLAYRPVRKASRLTMLIIAIGLSLLIEYGAQLVFGAERQRGGHLRLRAGPERVAQRRPERRPLEGTELVAVGQHGHRPRPRRQRSQELSKVRLVQRQHDPA